MPLPLGRTTGRRVSLGTPPRLEQVTDEGGITHKQLLRLWHLSANPQNQATSFRTGARNGKIEADLAHAGLNSDHVAETPFEQKVSGISSGGTDG